MGRACTTERMAEPTVYIRLEPVVVTVEDETAWCWVCCLPSACEVAIALVNSKTLLVFGHIRARFCEDCGTETLLD